MAMPHFADYALKGLRGEWELLTDKASAAGRSPNEV